MCLFDNVWSIEDRQTESQRTWQVDGSCIVEQGGGELIWDSSSLLCPVREFKIRVDAGNVDYWQAGEIDLLKLDEELMVSLWIH